MQKIILFDGECNFCNGSVLFIIKRDPKAVFFFASLQSEIGIQLKARHNISVDDDSFILIENSRAYTKSTAALRVARKLTGLWKLSYIFIIVPSFIRNLFYRFFARNRYKWFGKRETCMMPTPDIQKRFL